MGHWGKIIGGGIGFMIGGPVGAILGAGVGTAADQETSVGGPAGRSVRCPNCSTNYTLASGRWSCSECSTVFDVTHCSSCAALWTVSGTGWTCSCGQHIPGPTAASAPAPDPEYSVRCPGCQQEANCTAGVWTCGGCSTDFRVSLCGGCSSVWSVRGHDQSCDCGATLPGTLAPGESALSEQEEATYGLFMVPAVFGVLMALVDGHADPRELKRIHEFYKDDDEDARAQVRVVVEETLRDAAGADILAEAADLARDLGQTMESADRFLLIQMLYSVAWVDRVFHDAEAALIQACEEALEVPPDVREVLRWMWVTGDSGDQGDFERTRNSAFATLGLPVGAPLLEVKRRYRELALRYHPDKFVQMGEEFAEIATVKFKEVQGAYEALSARPAEGPVHALCPQCHELALALTRAGRTSCSHCESAVLESKADAWIVTCHFCATRNRVPHTGGRASPRCGRCRVIVLFGSS